MRGGVGEGGSGGGWLSPMMAVIPRAYSGELVVEMKDGDGGHSDHADIPALSSSPYHRPPSLRSLRSPSPFSPFPTKLSRRKRRRRCCFCCPCAPLSLPRLLRCLFFSLFFLTLFLFTFLMFCTVALLPALLQLRLPAKLNTGASTGDRHPHLSPLNPPPSCTRAPRCPPAACTWCSGTC